MSTIFPPNAQADDEYQGYRYDGIAWKIIGISLTTEYLTRQQADLLYQPFVSTFYDGGDSSTYTPTLIIDGGLSEVDFVDLIDANAA
jgi:hypothetical protein